MIHTRVPSIFEELNHEVMQWVRFQIKLDSGNIHQKFKSSNQTHGINTWHRCGCVVRSLFPNHICPRFNPTMWDFEQMSYIRVLGLPKPCEWISLAETERSPLDMWFQCCVKHITLFHVRLKPSLCTNLYEATMRIIMAKKDIKTIHTLFEKNNLY